MELHKALLDLCLEGLGCKDQEGFLRRVGDLVSGILEADFYKVLRFEGGDRFRLILHRGLDRFKGSEIKGNTKALYTLREGKVVFSEDFYSERRFRIPEFIAFFRTCSLRRVLTYSTS